MCIANASEVHLSLKEWLALFPNGLPSCYTDTDSEISIETSLPHIAKAQEKDFKQWATSRNAEVAERRASCRTTGVFPLLSALRRRDDY